MITNETTTKNLTDGRKLETKYDGHITRSGEYSAQLRNRPDCQDCYEQLQHSEIAVEAAKRGWDEARVAILASRAGIDTLRKMLSTLSRAAVNIAEQEGNTTLRDVLVYDANDEASAARRLAEKARALRFVGDGFSQAFSTLRDELLAREAAHQEIATRFDQATKNFGQAFYRGASVLAQAKALLFASGVSVSDKKTTKKKKVVPTPMPIAA